MDKEQHRCKNRERAVSTVFRKTGRVEDRKEIEAGLIEGGARAYKRNYDLPRLISLWPRELADETKDARSKIIAKLKCAIRAERQRGQAGHWAYSLDRHLGLLQALKAETAALKNMQVRLSRHQLQQVAAEPQLKQLDSQDKPHHDTGSY